MDSSSLLRLLLPSLPLLACGCTAPARAVSPPPCASVATVASVPDASRGAPLPAAAALPASHLSREDAAADVKEFVALLEATHPDCYTRFGGRVAFGSAVAALLRSIPADGETRAALRTSLQEFIARLHDGHTFIRSDDADSSSAQGELAVRFSVASDGLFVSATDLPELEHDKGALVLGFGGKKMGDLVLRTSALTATENEFGAYARLTSWLTSDAACARLLERDCANAPLELELRRADGERVVRKVTFGPPHGDVTRWRVAQPKAGALPNDAGMFGWKVWEKPSVGYLRIEHVVSRESFALLRRLGYDDTTLGRALRFIYGEMGRKMPEDTNAAIAGVPSFYDHANALLAQMKQKRTETLVVDLRGNDGGTSPMLLPLFYELYGDELYARPQRDVTATRYSELLLRETHKTIADIRRETHDDSLEVGGYVFDAPDGASANERRKKDLASFADPSLQPSLEAQAGRPLVRPRRVIVIANEETFSAATDALHMFQEMGAETLGVPPRQSPNTFIDTTDFELSRSKLGGSISHNVQLYVPEQPAATLFRIDHPMPVSVFQRYGFEADAPVRYALELAAGEITPQMRSNAKR